jgi:hypothetical protein
MERNTEKGGKVTQAELKGIIKKVLGFLEGDSMDHVDYLLNNSVIKGGTWTFPLDPPQHKYFMELEPIRRSREGTSSLMRCISEEERGFPFFQALVGPCPSTSYIQVSCESEIPGFSIVGDDEYGNIIQQKMFKAGAFAPYEGTVFIDTISPVYKIKEELRHLEDMLKPKPFYKLIRQNPFIN